MGRCPVNTSRARAGVVHNPALTRDVVPCVEPRLEPSAQRSRCSEAGETSCSPLEFRCAAAPRSIGRRRSARGAGRFDDGGSRVRAGHDAEAPDPARPAQHDRPRAPHHAAHACRAAAEGRRGGRSARRRRPPPCLYLCSSSALAACPRRRRLGVGARARGAPPAARAACSSRPCARPCRPCRCPRPTRLTSRARPDRRRRAPSLSRYLERRGRPGHVLEFMLHRSAYQLKEGGSHSFAIPRLSGLAKAALVEIQSVEDGGGRPERVHTEGLRRGPRWPSARGPCAPSWTRRKPDRTRGRASAV